MAAGSFALQWLDYQRLARSHTDEVYIFLVAAAFLVLGIVLGARVFTPRPSASGDGNPRAVTALGISARELAVLRELAAGRSTKEIAARIGVSPNTS